MHAVEHSVPAALRLGGLRLTNLALDDALAAIDAAITAREPMRIAFVNADCLNISRRDVAYRDAVNAMDWVFVDGSGMRLAGRLLSQPVRDNVNGTDLFPPLCADLAAKGRCLFLYGARPGVAERAAAWAAQQYPGLVIAGTEHGYGPESGNPALLQRIRDSQADVLLVAMGAPRQERWIHTHGPALDQQVVLAVGGLFDYYAGDIPRAPLWMRRTGLEWVFRLIQEPGRLWRRYLLGNLGFLSWVAVQGLRTLFSRSAT